MTSKKRRVSQKRILRYRSEVKTKDKLLSAIHKISRLLNRPITRDKILQALVNETKRVFDFHRVVIFLVNKNLLEVAYVIGFSPKEVARARKYPLDLNRDQCRETLVAKTGKTIYIRNAMNSSMVTEFDFKMDRIWNRTSTISMPLKIKNEIIGVLQGDRVDRELILSKGDLNMFSTFASQASISIENARLHEQTQKKISQLLALQEVSKKTSSTLNFRKLLDIISVNALKITNASACSLFLVDRDRKYLKIVSQKGYGGIDIEKFRMRIGEGIIGWVADKDVPLLVNDVSQEPRYVEIIPGMGSKLAVPLVSEKKALGVLCVDSCHKAAFSLDDLELLMVFASHTAALIENVRLYEQVLAERNVAENILESAPTGIVAIDEGKKIRAVNKKAEILLNLKRRAILGKKISDVFREDILDILNDTVNSRAVVDNREVEVVRKDGRSGIFGLTSSLLKSDENVTGALVSIQDLTEFKKTEELIRRMDRLSSLGQLSAGIAHEIRNPLASINFNVQLLAKKLDVSKNMEGILKDTFEGINRINVLVRRILDFTKTGTPSFKNGRIHDVLEEAIALIAPQLNKKEITVQRNFFRNVPEIVFDPHQIQQVCVNLFLNAMEAMPAGGVIEIKTAVEKSAEANGDKQLLITITDNGTGISQENIGKVFDPFFTTKSEGTGLGLSIVHKILEQHSASVEIKSKEGKGTSFILGFPIRRAV